MRTKRLERANFRVIELELYNYKNTKKEYEFLIDEILHGSPQPSEAIGASRGIDISNPTEKKVMKIVTSAHIIELDRRVKAIQFMIRMIENSPEPKKKELLDMKYFSQRYNDHNIIERLHIDRSTFFKWRKEIIVLVANQLGWRI